jgi:hypothetical protein
MDHYQLVWRLPQVRESHHLDRILWERLRIEWRHHPRGRRWDRGQIVTYTATYVQPFLTGTWLNLTSLTHKATVVVKNEPFENATC